MIRLRIAGALARSGTFPRSLDLDLVRTLAIPETTPRMMTEALMRDVHEATDDQPLQAALAECLEKHGLARELELSRRAALLDELRDWIRQIEAAKTWLEQQRAAWQSAAEAHGSVIAELRTQVGTLEDTPRAAWSSSGPTGSQQRSGSRA